MKSITTLQQTTDDCFWTWITVFIVRTFAVYYLITDSHVYTNTDKKQDKMTRTIQTGLFFAPPSRTWWVWLTILPLISARRGWPSFNNIVTHPVLINAERRKKCKFFAHDLSTHQPLYKVAWYFFFQIRQCEFPVSIKKNIKLF